MIAGALAAVAGVPASSTAAAPAAWPPVEGPGSLFVHYGEEHLDDDDGMRIFPKVIADSIRYRPRAVVTSADKASDGKVELLGKWKELMGAYDRAGIPYFPGVGNHDRKAPPGVPGGLSPVADLGNYEQVFADRPYPFGDAAPVAEPGFGPRERPANDPAGASSHYFFDYANVRWIVIDNSCYGITNCDNLQNPPFPNADEGDGQFAFLAKRAAEAKAAGKKVFVSMHMPTQDPRPEHTQPLPSPHTMGEGSSPDNQLFEAAAAAAKVDGVFLGHIKGHWTYTAQGVPYFTDGGAGGEVYVDETLEDAGTDYGYWHGYRLVRVLADGGIVTDAVPIFEPDGITVKGPTSVATRSVTTFEAFGKQPTEEGPKVDALELRDPDPARPNVANLPSPARIWTSGNPSVLRPVAGAADDPRRDPRTQTSSARFRATCPGATDVTITSGFESRRQSVAVTSASGPLLESVRGGARRIRSGRNMRVATARFAQPARLLVRVLRGRRPVRTLVNRCQTGRVAVVRWDGQAVRPGRYTVELRVLSDRKPIVRRLRVRVAGQAPSGPDQLLPGGLPSPRFTG